MFPFLLCWNMTIMTIYDNMTLQFGQSEDCLLPILQTAVFSYTCGFTVKSKGQGVSKIRWYGIANQEGYPGAPTCKKQEEVGLKSCYCKGIWTRFFKVFPDDFA